MKFVKRFLPLLVLVALIFASCATNANKVPQEPETPPATVTQGTPQEVQPQEQPQQPSVEKYELQNLFQQANALKAEATDSKLDSIDADGFTAVSQQHDIVAAKYKDLVETPAVYDGVKAFPLKNDLEGLIATWNAFIQKASSIQAKNSADQMMAAAKDVDAPIQAPAQFDAGSQYYSAGSTAAENADYAQALTSYQLASAAFESAAAAAPVNVLRADIEKNGYAQYDGTKDDFAKAEEKYASALDSWQKATLDDIKASTAAFKDAYGYYKAVDTNGGKLLANSGKEKAVAAQTEALQLKADVNAPDDYQMAMDTLAEADKNLQNEKYVGAYSSYLDAASAFETARDTASAKQQEASEAITKEEANLANAKDKASDLGLEDNIYLVAASEHMDKAKALQADMAFIDALFEANEVENYIGLSDNYITKEVETREKARVEQLAKDKAAADAAIADAKARIAWADQVDLKSDYPAEYKDASTSMSGAEIAYTNEKYAPAKTLAEEVSSTLSDDFQKQVLASREAAKAKAAQAEEEARQKVLNKQAADAAIADAEARMAWANENKIRDSYPDEYMKASVAIVGSYVAYGNEDYVLSTQKAEEVSSILSNEFQAQVNAEREAAEQLAKDKAAADEVMPKARDRMAWADQNNIKADYPAEYKDASTSMSGAEIAYSNEKYAPAAELANEVLSTLSSDFEAKVAADKAAKEMQAEIEQASKAADALGAAHARMAWADQVQLASDYPDEYRDASTSMQAADEAYSQKEYNETVTLSNDVARVLSDDFMAKINEERAAAQTAAEQLAKDKAAADEVMPKARDRMAWADQNNIKADYPAEYKDASTSMSGAEIAYSNEKYAPAAELANEVLSTLSSDFEAKVAADKAAKEAKAAADAKAKQEAADAQAAIAQTMRYAEVAINDAQTRYDWAASKNAANNYPEFFKQGGDALADAKTAFKALDYARAKDLAGQAYWTLMQINEFAPLPSTYTVRLIPKRRDCLWRIAEYSFIYNNPYKWPVLYKANKATFKDPSNPDLIYPGQILKIPSIKGETREGSWDPNKTYQPLAK